MNAKTLILAAGSSSRLGKKKQLLTYLGETLLNHTIQLCQECIPTDLYIVLGHAAEDIAQTLTSTSVHIIFHPGWADGMGTSLAKGIRSLPPNSTGVYIFLTDQIKLTVPLIKQLKSEAEQNPTSIICCRYGENYGAPTYFPSSHFDALSKSKGSAGAKKYIKEHLSETRFIDFEDGEIDIDYPEDLKHLKG